MRAHIAARPCGQVEHRRSCLHWVDDERVAAVEDEQDGLEQSPLATPATESADKASAPRQHPHLC